MNMFGLSTSVKGFEKKYLDSKNTGMTIEDFEQQHLKKMVHAYYMAQDLTAEAFEMAQRDAVAKEGTPEGDEATMVAGFLVGVNDAVHNPEFEFSIAADMKRKQLDGWAFFIGDQSHTLIGAVECLCDYAQARKLKPAQVLAKFPRAEFEQAFAEYEESHAE